MEESRVLWEFVDIAKESSRKKSQFIEGWPAPTPRFRITMSIPPRKKVPQEVGRVSHRQLKDKLWVTDRLSYALEICRDSVEIDPLIRSGVPVLRGTRVPISQIVAELADGCSVIEIASDLEIDGNLVVAFLTGLAIVLDQPRNEDVSIR